MAEDHQRYRIDERLHHGLVESWSGLDRTLDRPVTIRILDPSSEVGKRVQLQARSLVRLEHPSLLHVLDTIELDDRVGQVTEALPETSLEEHLALGGILSPEETLAVATQLGEALLSLHSAGFAIGDLQAKHIGRRKDLSLIHI